MWGLSIQFWQSVVLWANIAALVAGVVTGASLFVSAFVSSNITDIIQADADSRITEARARGEEARAEAAKANERANAAAERTASLEKEVAEADVRAAEANKKAAEAQLELSRFREPRLLTPEQQAFITEKLKPFPNTQFDTGLSPNDGEQADFLWLLEPDITAAGWVHVPWVGPGGVVTQGPTRPPSGSVGATGVSIHLHPEQRERLLPAASALISALQDVGIAASDGGFNTHNNTPSAIHVLIGRKM
jgi:chromosome segregation ATPase